GGHAIGVAASRACGVVSMRPPPRDRTCLPLKLATWTREPSGCRASPKGCGHTVMASTTALLAVSITQSVSPALLPSPTPPRLPDGATAPRLGSPPVTMVSTTMPDTVSTTVTLPAGPLGIYAKGAAMAPDPRHSDSAATASIRAIRPWYRFGAG